MAMETRLRAGKIRLRVSDIIYFHNSLNKHVRKIETLSLDIEKMSPRPNVSCLNFVARKRISKPRKVQG